MKDQKVDPMTLPITLIVTRPKAAAEKFAADVQDACPGKFDALIAPLMDISLEPCDIDVAGAQALLFTSRQAVAAYVVRKGDLTIPALCVGAGTAQEAQASGISAQSADGDAAALASLAAMSYLEGGGRYVHFRGAHTAGDLAYSLMDEGIEVEERIIYNQRLLDLSDPAKRAISDGRNVVIPVFSPRTAQGLANELANIQISPGVRFLVISQNTADQLSHLSARIEVAPQPSLVGMLNLLAKI